MSFVRAEGGVVLDAGDTLSLWKDTSRWATFVEGFAQVLELSPDWPEPGAKVVWQSIQGGRGRVTEKVLESSTRVFRTQLFEEAIAGEQAFSAAPTDDGRARVTLELSYELAKGGPLRGLNDVLFIRRAQRDSLGRTLRRFAVEAEEEAGHR